MKSTIFKYGSYSFLTGFVLFMSALVLFKGSSYATQEIIGYVSIFVSLSFVYFGIKHYRDGANGGSISFWKALLIGLLISACAGIGIGIMDYIYTTMINPDFAVEYEATMIQQMKETLSEAEFEQKSKELKDQMAAYGGSGFMAFIMFLTVVMMGFIISLISAIILQRK